MAGNRVSLALGSGGARGYAHIGVIDELRESGYDIVGIAAVNADLTIAVACRAARPEAATSPPSPIRGQRRNG
jgi:NTE family protein